MLDLFILCIRYLPLNIITEREIASIRGANSGTVVLVATYASETSTRTVVTYLADGDPRRHPAEIRSIFHDC